MAIILAWGRARMVGVRASLPHAPRSQKIGWLALIAIATERGMSEVVLNAQTQACDFYARHGFIAEGEIFLDAGIPHQRMRRSCRGPNHGVDSDAG